MRAIVQDAHGSADVLRLVENPQTPITVNEVFVEVRAAWVDRGTGTSWRAKVRCWPQGITAYGYAVESPLRLAHDASMAARVLELARAVPAPAWGRDELGAGEMWTCHSLTSCSLAARTL